MAQALGYVTKTENGSFEGTLSMMSLKKRISIKPNEAKESDGQPDFRVFTEDRIEIGGGWNRTGKVSGKDYISLTFAAPACDKGGEKKADDKEAADKKDDKAGEEKADDKKTDDKAAEAGDAKAPEGGDAKAPDAAAEAGAAPAAEAGDAAAPAAAEAGAAAPAEGEAAAPAQ